MKRKFILEITGTLIVIIAAILHFFLYIDLENNCVIRLVPSLMPGNLSTKKLIKVIKYASPEDYTTLCSTVKVINKNVSCGGFDGGCYESRKPDTVFLGNDQNNMALGAAIIIHELCHRQQMKEQRDFSEAECYQKGGEFMEKVVVY